MSNTKPFRSLYVSLSPLNIPQFQSGSNFCLVATVFSRVKTLSSINPNQSSVIIHYTPDNNKWLHMKQSSKLEDATSINCAMRATLPFILTFIFRHFHKFNTPGDSQMKRHGINKLDLGVIDFPCKNS